jgi:hypothetical protein
MDYRRLRPDPRSPFKAPHRTATATPSRPKNKSDEIGWRWLAGMQHRLGLPDVDYSRIAFFLLEDFIVHDENAYRALVGPTYTAHFTDGSILRYCADAAESTAALLLALGTCHHQGGRHHERRC